MVGRALGASAERKGRALVVEGVSVRESGLVFTLHIIIPFHISLSESLRIASTLEGLGTHPASTSSSRMLKKASSGVLASLPGAVKREA